MVRILAFALNAHENLEMTRGISTDDEPDIWQKSLAGELELWVALGLPSEKVVRQSCGKAGKVIVYPYGGRTAEIWWDKIKKNTTRFENLQVINFSEKDTGELAKLASRAMSNCSRPSYAVTCFGDGSRTSWMAWSADLRLSLPVAMTEAAAA